MSDDPARAVRVTVAVRIDAPAKLNLSLRVVGRRADGYHELESELVLLDLADRLLLMPGCSGLRVEGPQAGGIPVDEENLAWRGLVAGLGARPDLACLTLEKRIPAAAGLGGGSSDAAAAWRLGRTERGIEAPPDAGELATLAVIGADVPFFATAIPAGIVRGIGERIEPVPPHRRAVVLVHPPFGCETRAVFGELRPDEWGRGPNDLLAPALRLRPALAEVMDAVRRAGGEPQLTGSGSTVFALEDDADRAARLAGALRDGGLRVTLTGTRLAAATPRGLTDAEEGADAGHEVGTDRPQEEER